jgi:dimethylglycine dehydrogenase
LKSQVRVLVIGGGVVGCSVLYHLAKLGWTDIALCERKELTAGSSWHAAGMFHALNGDATMSRLQSYTINLYRELEKFSGQDIGLHYTGGLNVAATAERWDLLRADCERHRVLGLDTTLMSPGEVAERFPLMDVSDVKGALFDPMEGYLDPYGATIAYAKAAKKLGAEVYRHTRVTALTFGPRRTWTVTTDQGSIEAEHVVNAGGLWAREVGHLAGVELPLVPMEHHYLITEDIPEIAQLGRELPVVVDLDGEMYLRPERHGLLLGVYERDATPWSRDGTPWAFGDNELLPPQLDRLTDSLEKGFRRFPKLNTTGIRKIVNGPFTFTPDGNPLVGPVPGLRNFWSACGVMAGFAQGGGVGKTLAEWMTAGEPECDVFGLDVARFGPYATRDYVAEKSSEFYSRRFRIAYPNEFWPAARPAKVTALHNLMQAENAVFGVSYGVETALYFAPKDQLPQEAPSLRRSNAFEQVAEECRAARSKAGILDCSAYAKYEVSGNGAHEALDRLLAGKLPGPGRIRLTPMLAPSGRLMGDLTAFCLAEDRYLLFGSGYLQNWHMRWFAEHFEGTGASVHNRTEETGGIAIFGPHARELLSQLSREDVSDNRMPFMTFRHMDVAGAPALAARISVTGELGYEIYVPAMYLAPLYERFRAAGAHLGLRGVGMYALNSLRLEKGYGYWSREYSRDYTPMMSGLSRFVDYEKREFVGRDAALRERDMPPAMRLVTLEVDALDAEASFYEPVSLRDKVAGFVTSGGFGHCIGKSLAMAYVDQSVIAGREPLEVSIIGDRRRCRILGAPAIDPEGKRLRS